MDNFSYGLTPLYTKQKSFYGKAIVHAAEDGSDNYYTLYSYGTAVVSVYVGPDDIPYIKRLWGGYSATTMRHVNELLMQEDFPRARGALWKSASFIARPTFPPLKSLLNKRLPALMQPGYTDRSQARINAEWR